MGSSVGKSPQRLGEMNLLPYYVWNESENDWIAFESTSIGILNKVLSPKDKERKTQVKEMSIYTQNVWFNNLFKEERSERLMRNFQENIHSDIFCLQEVTASLLEYIKADSYIRENYVLTNVDTTVHPRNCWYGVLMLIRKGGFKGLQYRLPMVESHQGRDLLVHVTRINNELVAFSTIHLESCVENSEFRLQQLRTIFQHFRQLRDDYGVHHAFLMGDMNFDPKDEEQKELTKVFHTIDSWLYLHPDVPGYTEDPKKNIFRKGQQQRRYDRIFVVPLEEEVNSKKQKEGGSVVIPTLGKWLPLQIEMVGVEPWLIEGERCWISDHFGVSGLVGWKPAGEV